MSHNIETFASGKVMTKEEIQAFYERVKQAEVERQHSESANNGDVD